MIRKILVATDGSPVSFKALAFATDLAKQTGASVRLLGVIDRSYFFSTGMPPTITPSEVTESTEDVIRQAVENYLDAAVNQSLNKGVEVSAVIRTGHPVEEILKEAEEGQADLIILGSHGRSALRAAVLGSVAYGVLHKDAKFPVLVVRRDPD